jgi:hypothetical protein
MPHLEHAAPASFQCARQAVSKIPAMPGDVWNMLAPDADIPQLMIAQLRQQLAIGMRVPGVPHGAQDRERKGQQKADRLAP